MKKVMVYAYTTFNLGDDLFIKILCQRYPNTNFVLYAPRDYKLLFKDVNNLTIFPNDSLMVRGINFAVNAVCRSDFFVRKVIAKSCDIGVFIGGSLFIQGENWREGLKNIKNMRIENKPFFLLGANFGPYKEKDYFLEYKAVFEEFTDICFREKHSYKMFDQLSNVRMGDDIIFQLKREETEKQDNNILISVIKPSVRKYLANYDEIYYKKVKDIAVYFIEKGYRVTLMSFCELEGDNEAVKTVMNLIPKTYLKNITTFLYKLDIEKALKVIANSSFIVATRFHSMILGWIYKKPVYPIVYSEKMTNVMKDIGFKGLFTDFENIYSLEPKQVFESMKTNLIDVSNQVINSERHFEKLDKYLKK
ncbi:hypothetical protein DRW41_10590 [Neobacillus piezotolerans]|uniref:Polysaccharide pyruvyl transferase domain-containing protein n=1 Tax=Neobacillus piezotolerans TaxID=2259171 RepID=A0A3D8GS50_9BACI|nr:polysaccharide pyruvyl transferase family protein [Neobacillus piezotolerans]RDU37122.1 hypothetical protein DRW41_10590 [Neobacillus piezotolerans]